MTYKLCLSQVTLWNRDTNTEPCPSTLNFKLTLPTTFSDEKDTYVSEKVSLYAHTLTFSPLLSRFLLPTTYSSLVCLDSMQRLSTKSVQLWRRTSKQVYCAWVAGELLRVPFRRA